jgi:hypothetical protein
VSLYFQEWVDIGITTVLLWFNYDQDISVSLRSTSEDGIFVEEITSKNHELCVWSQELFVLWYGVWPVWEDFSVIIDDFRPCRGKTEGGVLKIKLNFKGGFDHDVLKNGRPCVLLNYSYNKGGAPRSKFYCK